MEIYCRKQAQGGVLEYKMIEGKDEHAEFGSISRYGFRVKYCAADDFAYYSADNISAKPQAVMQIIKFLFDQNVMPEQVFEKMQAYLLHDACR